MFFFPSVVERGFIANRSKYWLHKPSLGSFAERWENVENSPATRPGISIEIISIYPPQNQICLYLHSTDWLYHDSCVFSSKQF